MDTQTVSGDGTKLQYACYLLAVYAINSVYSMDKNK